MAREELVAEVVLGVKLGVLCYSCVREKVLLMFQNPFLLWRMCPVNASIAFFHFCFAHLFTTFFLREGYVLPSRCVVCVESPPIRRVGQEVQSVLSTASRLILNVSNRDWIPKGPLYLCGYGYLKNNFQRHHPIATDCKEFLFIRC